MHLKTIRLSSKGQITLPADMLRALHADKGTEFVVIQENEKIVLIKSQQVAQDIVDDFQGWESLGASVFDELWDNDEDEIWNDL